MHNFRRMILRSILLNSFLFLTLNYVQGQETVLYNTDGKLKIDTLLKTDINERDAILAFENYLLPDIYSRIEYPTIAVENAIEGSLICKLKYTKPNLLQITFLKYVDRTLDDAVLKGIKEIEDKVCRYLNEKAKNNTIVIYLPVIFEIEKNKFEENLKIRKCILIRKEALTKQKMIVN